MMPVYAQNPLVTFSRSFSEDGVTRKEFFFIDMIGYVFTQ